MEDGGQRGGSVYPKHCQGFSHTKKPAMPRQTSPDVYMAYADGPAMPSSICLLISAYLQRAAEQMIGQHPQIFETSHWRI